MSRSPILALGFLALGFLGACATAAPPELVDARSTYQNLITGPAASANPVGVHEAKKSLDRAEREFQDHADAPSTRDFAYMALRKAQLAETEANIAVAVQQKAQAERTIQQAQLAAQQRSRERAEGDLSQTRRQLTDAERQRQEQAERLAQANQQLQSQNERLQAEREARQQAEKNAQEVQRNLASIAQVREEPRGLVITLSGSVLFPSGRSTLLPDARSRLDQVADALSRANQSLVVEGYTDSRGSNALNKGLSERRAQVVRDYLVQRGIPGDRVNAVGFGKTRPVADNRTPEGRANNRRVEIVVQRPDAANKG